MRLQSGEMRRLICNAKPKQLTNDPPQAEILNNLGSRCAPSFDILFKIDRSTLRLSTGRIP
jgi:hypothetical protein